MLDGNPPLFIFTMSNPESSTPALPPKPPVLVLPVTASAAPVTADELTEPLATAMPAPTVANGEFSETPAPVEIKDSRNKIFDPAIHAAKEDGTPAKNKHGRFYPKNLGKHGNPTPKRVEIPAAPRRADPSFANVSGGGPAPSSSTPLEVMPLGEDEYTALAEVYLQMSYGPLMALFSAEIRPIPDEHHVLKHALAGWLRSMKAKQFSPGMAFALAASGIFMAKFEKPTVREKGALLWVRVKQIWSKWTGKKTGGDK